MFMTNGEWIVKSKNMIPIIINTNKQEHEVILRECEITGIQHELIDIEIDSMNIRMILSIVNANRNIRISIMNKNIEYMYLYYIDIKTAKLKLVKDCIECMDRFTRSTVSIDESGITLINDNELFRSKVNGIMFKSDLLNSVIEIL